MPNWRGARRPASRAAHIHFFTACKSGAEQARNFIAAVPRDPAALPPVIDVEHDGLHRRRWPGGRRPRWRDREPYARGREALRRPPIVYTTEEFQDAVLERKTPLRGTFWARSLVIELRLRTRQWRIWRVSAQSRPRRDGGIKAPWTSTSSVALKADFERFAAAGSQLPAIEPLRSRQTLPRIWLKSALSIARYVPSRGDAMTLEDQEHARYNQRRRKDHRSRPLKEAERTKTQMCIAVVDSGADLKAFFRMDGAWVGSIDIAIKKATTAVFFGMPTGAIGKLSQPGGPLVRHRAFEPDGLITFPGGLPIVDNEGVLVGAIGVSGSSVENDHIVATAGVKPVGVSDLPEHPWRT